MIRKVYCKLVPGCVRTFMRTIIAWFDNCVAAFTVCDLQRRSNNEKRARVGFFVVFDSCFQMESVFNLMRDDTVFDPEIVVIPDTARGDSHMRETYEKTYSYFRRKYGDRVVDVRNKDGTFKDIARNYDICALMNPYPGMTSEQFTIRGVARRRVPAIFMRYYYDEGSVWSPAFNALQELKWLTRFYVENPFLADELGKVQPVLRTKRRIVVSGCSKIDALSYTAQMPSSRKRILIAPHHTITKTGGVIAISNFLRLKDFLLSLPRRYPEIDWILRPHPLLMFRMVNEGFWTAQDRDKWIAEWNVYSNSIYEDGGSYLNSFVNSDAMIQDCGSFLPEYFYTNHPQCYVLRDRNSINEQFVDWGKKLLSHTYKAFSEQDIIDFIENVVIAGRDAMKEEREKFARERLIFNYPHASEAIVADIKKALGRN